MKTDRSAINDPSHPEYNTKARDAIMDLCPFYDPNHKCGVVRDHVYKAVLTEMRERERLALESGRRADALSSSGMAKILKLESQLATAKELCQWAFDSLETISAAHGLVGNATYAQLRREENPSIFDAQTIPENIPARPTGPPDVPGCGPIPAIVPPVG